MTALEYKMGCSFSLYPVHCYLLCFSARGVFPYFESFHCIHDGVGAHVCIYKYLIPACFKVCLWKVEHTFKVALHMTWHNALLSSSSKSYKYLLLPLAVILRRLKGVPLMDEIFSKYNAWPDFYEPKKSTISGESYFKAAN